MTREIDQQVVTIVSGLPRSGTSMMMKMLEAGGMQVLTDHIRTADEDNPKGYYELEGGKIINKLMDGTFPLIEYKGKIIKITSYGLKYLPPGDYKIIYSERNIEEILDSMEEMTGIRDKARDETKKAFIKLNKTIKETIKERKDIDVLFVNYNEILMDPIYEIRKLLDFLETSEADIDLMIETVDKKLYRRRRV